MGAIMQPLIGGNTGGHFATAGGFGGTGLPAPMKADVQQGTSLEDVAAAQQGAQNSLASQQTLLNALKNQRGLQQQNAVAQQQQGLANQLAAANGVGTQNQAISGLQNTADMYRNIASGQGPNPAQAALNQATGQNVANQSAMMAGQRGAGSNIGLMARQAAQQGANTQQQAVGQGATLQAQQQMNALSGLAAAQQAVGGLGSTQVGQQQGQQGAMANQANQVANQQISQSNANAQANMANQQAQQQALSGINNANITNQGNLMSTRAGLQQAYIGSQQKGLEKLADSMGGGGNMMGGAMMAEGGNVFAEANPYINHSAIDESMPQSSFGKFMNAPMQQSSPSNGGNDYTKLWSGKSNQTNSQSMAGSDASQMPSNEAVAYKGGLAGAGGNVNAKNPSEKAVAPGDDYANDKISAKLSQGEIVLPRSVTMSDDPVGNAAKFVAEELKKRKAKGGMIAMANGGGVEEDKGAPPPVPQQTMPQPAQAQAQEPLEKMDVSESKGEPVKADLEVEEPIKDEAVPQAGGPSPAAPVAPQGAPSPDSAPDQSSGGSTYDDKLQEHMRFAQDLADNKITPKTYHDILGTTTDENGKRVEKGALGKLGTLFGLFMSGMGSGVSHQPNVLLHMMDKEIERDLEAQKNSKEGARNLLSIPNAHNLQQAQAAEHKQRTLNEGVEGSKQAAIAGKVLDKMHIKNDLPGEYERKKQEIWAPFEAKAKMREIKGHQLDQATKNNPQANAVVRKVILPAIVQKNVQTLKQGEAAVKLGTQKLHAQEPIIQAAPAVNNSKYQEGIRLGKESPWIEGSIIPEDVPKVDADIGVIQQARRGGKRWEKSFNELVNMPRAGETGAGVLGSIAGSLSNMIPGANAAVGESVRTQFSRFEKRRNAIVNDLQAYLPAGTEDERKKLMDAYLPKWEDIGDQDIINLKFNNAVQHFKDLEKTPTLDRYPSIKGPDQEYNLKIKEPVKDEKGENGKVTIKNGYVYGKSGKKYKIDR